MLRSALLSLLLLTLAAPVLGQPTAPLRLPQDGQIGFERPDWNQVAPPMDTTVRTRQAAGFLAMLPAGLLFVLYLYRRRAYLLAWIASWCALAASLYVMTLGSDFLRASPDSVAGQTLVGVAQVLGTANALLLLLGAVWFRQPRTVPRRLTIIGTSLAVWFIGSAMLFGVQIVLISSYLVLTALFASGAILYARIGRQYRFVGPYLVAAGMLAVSGTDVYACSLVIRGAAGVEVPNLLVFISIVWKAVVGLGMHLLVFEDMSSELRVTNANLARAQDELKALAVTDPLTGCYNRRFFDEVVQHELGQHRRHRLPLSLLFVDCDRFKAINDRLGHDAGDEVLRLIARLLRERVRQADYVFRWGGDEFLVLLSCEEPQALVKASDIREAFLRDPLTRRMPEGTGLSIGCVAVPLETFDLMPLIQRADERMYANKRRTA